MTHLKNFLLLPPLLILAAGAFAQSPPQTIDPHAPPGVDTADSAHVHPSNELHTRCQVHTVGIPGAPKPGAQRGGPLVIDPNFAGGVSSARQAVFEEAIAEWEAIVLDSGTTPNPYEVAFKFSAFDPNSSTLAVTTTTYYTETGNLAYASINFNENYPWYEDPDPSTDDEFEGGSPPPDYDLLTVARHELGHAVGHANIPRVQALLSGNDFDPPRLNTAWTTVGGGHTDPAWLANDIMVPSIGTSIRRPISLYPAASVVARAYEYEIPMRYVDAAYTGYQDGSANLPYRTLSLAVFAPAGLPLLLSNDTHEVAQGWSTSGSPPHTIRAARGGALVIAP